MKMVGTLLLFSLLTSGCVASQSYLSDTCPSAPNTDVFRQNGDSDSGLAKVPTELLEFAEGLIGLEEHTALSCIEAANLTWRVIARDGDSFAVTLDYRIDRINVAIERSRVSETSIG